jgi:OOP family OmpA-OmpF porin
LNRVFLKEQGEVSMVRLAKFGVFASLLFLLGSCQSFNGMFSADGNLAAAKNAGPPAGAFDAALQQEYIGIAQTELDEYDWQHGDLFARKGIAAGNGEAVMPEDPSNWQLSADKAEKLSRARQMLLDALNGGGREKAPGDAARAQAMYDCWVQEEETRNEGHQPADIAFCRDGFFDALAKVQEAIMVEEPMAAPEPAPVPPEPPARDYLVFFDFDKTDIRSDSAAILSRVVQAMAALGSNSVTLTGHADRAGNADYNQDLSERRATSVRDYLGGKGITTGISTSGKGESDPRVPTPDGVSEQENRRVEIRIN